MKQYRLLRNNKESGPYTAAQLIQLGLKPYDLVWLDGRSAAWRYPGEMDEFKPYAPPVEEQPFDRFFNKPSLEKLQRTSAILPTQPADVTVKPPTAKPRIRVKADWNQVGEPTKQVIAAAQAPPDYEQPAPVIKQAIDTTWEKQWLDWQQEKKAVENAGRFELKPLASNNYERFTEPLIETKFSQSLDSLKLRYADTVLKARGKASMEWFKQKTPITFFLLAMPVLGFGIWMGSSLQGSAAAPKPTVNANNAVVATVHSNTVQVTAADNGALQAGIAANTAAITPKVGEETKEVIPNFDDDNVQKQTSPQIEGENERKKAPVVNKTLETVEKKQLVPIAKQIPRKLYSKQSPATMAQQPHVNATLLNNDASARVKVINPILVNPTVNNNPAYTQSRQVQPAAPPNKPAEKATPIFTHYTKEQKIDDYVTVEATEPTGAAVQNLTLNVQNVTDAKIDLVVIDVQYFDASGKFKAGQTMYVKNIAENETIRVNIPDNMNASKIKHKVSLVSVEQKGVYLVAE